MGVCVCGVMRTLTVSQHLGLTGRTETNVVKNEERQVGAALMLELAQLCKRVQAAIEPQDHLLPVFSQGHIQEELQPKDGQVTEMSVSSFRQC